MTILNWSPFNVILKFHHSLFPNPLFLMGCWLASAEFLETAHNFKPHTLVNDDKHAYPLTGTSY